MSVPATIALNGSLSDSVDLGGGKLAGIIMSPAWTAAVITFQGSEDGTTFYDLYDRYGSEISWTVVAGKLHSNDDIVPFLSLRYLKVRSGTTASAVTQEAERTLGIITNAV
jgi:hypothetical protein